MEYWKNLSEIFKNLATIIGLFVAGLWTYMIFIRSRQKYPRADISHQILHRELPTGKIILNVITTITNSGSVLLSLISGKVWIQQVLPLSEEMMNKIEIGEDPVQKDKSEIDWPLLGERIFKWEKGCCEIEPGEKDQFVADFIVDAGIKTVAIYSYFQNIKKLFRGRELGWGITTFHDVKKKNKPLNFF